MKKPDKYYFVTDNTDNSRYRAKAKSIYGVKYLLGLPMKGGFHYWYIQEVSKRDYYKSTDIPFLMVSM